MSTSTETLDQGNEDQAEVLNNNTVQKVKNYWEHSSENIFALFMAILAASLAINDLMGGRYGDDEIMLTNEKSNQFMWYQSKSIKEYVVKGQLDTLDTLLKSGTINAASIPAFIDQKKDLQENIKRYQKEKQEIMLGSNAVGKENWVQDIDGKLGQVVGAKEIEGKLSKLSFAGDKFDMASLFFQLALVIGALGILIKKKKIKEYALLSLFVLGGSGLIFSIKGLLVVL
jgi:hypothetical protein